MNADNVEQLRAWRPDLLAKYTDEYIAAARAQLTFPDMTPALFGRLMQLLEHPDAWWPGGQRFNQLVPEWTLDERATRIYRGVFGPSLDYAMLPTDARCNPALNGELPTGGEVLLAFLGGTKVRLWTSEWGGVEVYDETEERP